MPNVRGKNQTLITCPMDADLLNELDTARGRATRSQWVREAIAAKLCALGHSISDDLIFPPSRTKACVKKDANKRTARKPLKSGVKKRSK